MGERGAGEWGGGFLAACQLPTAALQHVNMSVARETRRACIATRSIETLSRFLSNLKCSGKILLRSCPARRGFTLTTHTILAAPTKPQNRGLR